MMEPNHSMICHDIFINLLFRDLQFSVSNQIKWFLQTFYGGFLSLKYLWRMTAATKKQA